MKIFNNQKIFGREKEITIIKNAILSKVAELVAFYGRRRVGKSFLVHHFLSDYTSKNEGKCVYLNLIGQLIQPT